MVRPAISLCFALLLVCVSTLAAQGDGKPAQSYKLLSIQVKGLTHLSEATVVRASGLQIGQMAGEEDFKQALQKLGDTGLFSNLAYSYQYSNAGCDLDFHAAETDKLVPAAFDNFVWFPDQELIDLLHARVPSTR